MKTIKLDLEFPDEFEPGDCYECPLSYEQEYYDEEDGWDYWTSCTLGRYWNDCPLEKLEEFSNENISR